MEPLTHYYAAIRFWYQSKKEVHFTDDLHIHFLINNPEIFDVTMEEIITIYRAYDEPLGTEGKARIQLLKKVFRKGWVRGRYEQQRKTLFLETDNSVKREKELQECIGYFQRMYGSTLKDYDVKIL